MFEITEDQRKQLLAYMWQRPYGEVAQHIAMLASLKQTSKETSNDNGKQKDMPKVQG